MAKRTKKDLEKADGTISSKEIDRIRGALREVWQWTSVARRRCIARATDKEGFGHCEKCKKKCPKVFADHIVVLGNPLRPKYIQRLWCASSQLQALCKKCHDRKTKLEREAAHGKKPRSFL